MGGLINRSFCDRSRDVATPTNSAAKFEKTPPSFVALALQNGLENRKSGFRSLNGND